MKKKENIIMGLVALVIIFLFAYINHFITSQVDDLVSEEPTQQVIKEVKEESPEPVERQGTMAHILHIKQQAPSNDYIDHTIIKDKQVISTYKTKRERVFELTGDFPDGKLKFVDEDANTYGFENYEGGVLHGAYTEYYATDILKVEAEYKYGQLLRRKSYHYNGQLKMEEDYEVGGVLIDFIELNDYKEAGIGKIYRINGKLKYEWSIVDGNSENFTKTYNRHGELIEAQYFDESGNLTKHWKKRDNSVETPKVVENK